MIKLAQITVPRQGDDAEIQLLLGDLTKIPPEHAADILVISAYPRSYVPVPGTLMAALHNNGIFVNELAAEKEINLLDQLGCWLSKPLAENLQQQFRIKRILCFEPGTREYEQHSVVGNIFRCINTFAFDVQNNVIAMPLLASGNQKIPVEKMLPAIIEAAIFWFENGLPLKCLKLALFGETQVQQALPIFMNLKENYELLSPVKLHFASVAESIQRDSIRKSELQNSDSNKDKHTEIRQSNQSNDTKHQPPAVDDSLLQTSDLFEEYDLFISYAHAHNTLITAFVENLKKQNPQLKVFYDKNSIPSGGIWLKHISDAIQRSRKVLVFLSPDYNNSPVCWDEFQCAKLIEYKRKAQIIQTIYLYDYKELEMPPIMGIYNWIDCREADSEKLNNCLNIIL